MSRSLRTAGCYLLLLSAFVAQEAHGDTSSVFQLTNAFYAPDRKEAFADPYETPSIKSLQDYNGETTVYGGSSAHYNGQGLITEGPVYIASAHHNTLDDEGKYVLNANTITGGYAIVKYDKSDNKEYESQANNNNVKLSKENTYSFIFGGHSNFESDSGFVSSAYGVTVNADDNTVESNVDSEHLYGGYSDISTDQNKNSVSINSYADGNAVINTGSTIQDYIGGGYVHGSLESTNIGAHASSNNVTLSRSTASDVFGGKIEIENMNGQDILNNAVTNDNNVNLTKSITQNIYGGMVRLSSYGETPNAKLKVVANNNTVTADEGSSTEVYGGFVGLYSNTTDSEGVKGDAKADNNIVELKKFTGSPDIDKAVYGGKVEVRSNNQLFTANATADKNSLTITKSGTVDKVYGGHAELECKGTASASENTGELSEVTAGEFFGGLASVVGGAGHDSTATASSNIFTMNNGEYKNAVGGQALVTGGTSIAGDIATASSNEISMNGGKSTGLLAGAAAVVSGTGTASALDNKVTLDNATSSGTLAAASAQVTSGVAEASSNSASVQAGGTYTNLAGGLAMVTAGSSAEDKATASSNRIAFKDTHLGETAWGGFAEVKGDGKNAAQAEANGNTVQISQAAGATAREIYGGLAHVENAGTCSLLTASANKLELTNGSYANIYGGRTVLERVAGSVTASGNTGDLSEVTAGEFFGGLASVAGGAGHDSTATASSNIFTMEKGEYKNATGGYALVSGGTSVNDTATAQGNLITLKNGKSSEGFSGAAAIVTGTGTARASENTATLDNAASGGTLAAATSYVGSGTADASSNKAIVLTGGTYANLSGGVASVAAGGADDSAKASSNSIELQDAELSGTALGGHAYVKGDGEHAATAVADSNIVQISQTGKAEQIYGGLAHVENAGTGSILTASANKLKLQDGSYSGIYGGNAILAAAGTATANGNNGELGDVTAGQFVGGLAQVAGGTAAASENIFTLKNSVLKNAVGGQSITETGSAESLSNVTTMTNAVSTGTVYGGSSAIVNGTALAQENKAVLTGGTYKDLVGGLAAVLTACPTEITAGDATEGTETHDSLGQREETARLMTSADIPAIASESTSAAAGASGGTGTVIDNEVWVTDGTVTGVTAGGLATAEASGNAMALSNSVKLKRSEKGTSSYSGTVFGGLARVAENGTAEVSANTFELDSGSFASIYGGSAEVAGKGTAKATGQVHELDCTSISYTGSLVAGKASAGKGQAEASSNSFALRGVYTGNVLAGQAVITNAGSASDSANAENNMVTASDAVVHGDLHTGFAYVSGNGSASASGNKIVLKGGMYGSNISAGYVLTTDTSTVATAMDNTMVLALGSDGKSSPLFNAQETVLFGGFATADGTTEIHANTSNNTQRYEYVKGMTAANIKGFTNFDFTLPDICAGETILTLTGGTDGETTSIANATAKATVGKVYGEKGGILHIWDKVYLLKNANGIDSTDLAKLPVEYAQGPVISRKGMFITEGLIMKTDENSLYLTTEGPDMDRSGAKAISEGASAGLALVNEAADSVIELMKAVDRSEWLVFGRISGGKSQYETGSSIDLTSLSMIAGVGKGFDTDAGFLTVGAFFEYGTGSYTTHNSFARRSDVDGDGQSKYMGGGLMAKMDFKDTGPGHFYADATAHMGNLHTSFDSNDITDEFGRVATFDYDTPYYSFHGSLGYQWDLADKHVLDVYGKYIWTKVQCADVDLSTGDVYKFDDMTSTRLRLGATYSYTGHSMFSPYVGAAWEHEFSGKCEATSYGIDVASPSFRGDTFRGELGIKTTESEDMPLTLNLGVQGFAGKRNGVSGNFYFRYDF